MSGISNASAMALVAALCQLIAVVWLAALCLRAMFGSLDVPGFLRGLAVVVILGQVLPAVTGSLRPTPLSDGQPMVAAYQQLAVALGGAQAGDVAPGTPLVERSVQISAGIWSGIVTSGLILLPVVAWMIVVAVELVNGAPLPALALRVLWWWLLWSVCAGGVGTTLSRATYQLATAVVQSAIVGVHQETTAPAPAPAAAWSVPEVIAAATAATLPAALATITAPLVHSLQRVLPPDGAAYQQVAASGFIGAQAQGALRGIYLVSASGADPHAGFSREYPSLDPLLSHSVTPNLFLNAPDLDAWLARALSAGDGSVIDGTGMVVGVVPIGDCTGVAQQISSGYAALVARDSAHVQHQLALVTQGQSGGIAANAWTALLQERAARLADVHAPTIAFLTSAPLAGVVAARYQAYYAAVLAQYPEMITAHQVAHADAWGVLCLVAGADRWPSAGTGTPLPGDPFARLACAACLRAGMEAPPLNPDERPDAGRPGSLLGRVSAGLIQVLVDSSLSLASLVLAAAVWLLAPLVVQLGFYQIALGCFVLNLAYPVAAFLALFPRQASVLVEWAKAVFWIALCIPFIVIGISLATPPNAAAVITPVLVLSARLAGGALGGMAASALSGPGTTTGAYLTMLTGMVMIVMSWWFATLMLQPGLSGLTSATRWMTQAGATLVASAAGGTGHMARGIAQGLRAAGRLADAVGDDAGGAAAPPELRSASRAHAGIARGAVGVVPGSGGTPVPAAAHGEGRQALQQAWSRLRALTDPAVAGAAWSALAGGAVTDAAALIDAAAHTRAEPVSRRPATAAAQAQHGISADAPLPRTSAPAVLRAASGDDLRRDPVRESGYQAGMQALTGPPQALQCAVAARWMDQAGAATRIGDAAPAARAALASAVQSGDWPLIGRAAGLVRAVGGTAEAGAAAARPAHAAVVAAGVVHSHGVADAVSESLAAACEERARSLGLPTCAGSAINALDDPEARARSTAHAHAAADAVTRDLAGGQVASAMASAALGATHALHSGDRGALARADGQLLTAAGAVLALSSLDPTYEQAISSACRGMRLLQSPRFQDAQRSPQDAGDRDQGRTAPGGDEREDALQRLLAAARRQRQPGGDHAG